MLRLGLIGASNQGREHLQGAAFSDKARFAVVCDASEDVRVQVREDYPQVPCVATIREMMEEVELDGVVLALPHHVYCEIWQELMVAGLPTLKEKPLGRTLSEANRFIAEARKAGCPLVTAIQRREHQSYRILKEQLPGAVVRSIRADLHLGFDPNETPRSWRGDPSNAGGGALLDSGYHMVDLVHYLVGPITLFSASIWAQDSPGLPEMLETDATLLGRSGATWVRIESQVGGRPDSSRPSGYAKNEEVVLETDRGVFVADRSQVVRNGETIWTGARDWQQAMTAQIDAFAERIRTDRFDDPNVWAQIPAMRVIEEAYGLARLVGPVEGGR
jgi:predicted dehydrogenase